MPHNEEGFLCTSRQIKHHYLKEVLKVMSLWFMKVMTFRTRQGEHGNVGVAEELENLILKL
jgi:hypothetical protein